MFTLYGNGKIFACCKTKKECKEAEKEYKEIEKAMYGKRSIKFKIVKELSSNERLYANT